MRTHSEAHPDAAAAWVEQFTMHAGILNGERGTGHAIVRGGLIPQAL